MWLLFVEIATLFILFYVGKKYKEKKNALDKSKVDGKMMGFVKKYFIVFFFLLLGAYLLSHDKNQENLHLIVKSSMNSSTVMTPNWYFFSKDKIYAYTRSFDPGFYSYDLDGSNKEVVVEDDIDDEEIRYPYFYMVKNDEAYYSMNYDRSLRKVNLNTGKITVLVKNKFLNLIPDTLEDGKILVTYTNILEGESHVYFARLDLQTFALTEEITVDYNAIQPYFYSKKDNSIYYIGRKKSADEIISENTYTIYKNNDVIFSYEADLKIRNTTANFDFVFVQDGYIFAIIFNKILKMSPNNYSIIEEKNIDDRYYLIKSGSKGVASNMGEVSSGSVTLETPIFENENDIYVFDSKSMQFEKIIDNNQHNLYVQKYEGYLVIENNKQIIIYNIETQEYKKYDAYNYTVEDDYIYLMTYKNAVKYNISGFYKDENFKVEKILLEDI